MPDVSAQRERSGAVQMRRLSWRPQESESVYIDHSMREALFAAVPSLRAFAISLCGNLDRADDLVQETLLRALKNIESFRMEQPHRLRNATGFGTCSFRSSPSIKFLYRANE
jgi:hypothetical protein